MNVGSPFLLAANTGFTPIGKPQGCQQVPSCTGTEFECALSSNQQGQCQLTQNTIVTVVAKINWETSGSNPDPAINVIIADAYKKSQPACIAVNFASKTYYWQFAQDQTGNCFVDELYSLATLQAASLFLTLG
ncbi:hypothetical protein GTA08_BOTSDO06150 [Botryosphaeria dothidea]|uniref:Uncharacterized protein n=1 Tax=Botryosphaeria dothidea TaxID=55169 RepID=A0A8H4IIV8_9PEZI|nr:hypothetical protein GTA08_BOTSDO10349 [Botryosphaeria dothidea]KAF4305520.1 hypothetical protein GTA08_BOTSDO06150 [Botryosphaeria dothidea]